MREKSILITGCSTGIGYYAAKSLHTRGYQVFAAVRNKKDQERLFSEGLNSILLDVDKSDSIASGVEKIMSQTNGQLYALINNAGFGLPGALEDLSRDSLRKQFETNVFGLQELTNQVIPVMRKQGEGRIIHVSSILGVVSMAYRGAYCASKFAVEGLADALRLELSGSGVFVSLIEPGPIESAFRQTAKTVWQDHINAEESAHKIAYQNLLDNMEKMKQNSPFTLGPEAVVKKVIHALENKYPKIRYRVTLPAHMLFVLKRLLPDKWMDAFMLSLARKETK